MFENSLDKVYRKVLAGLVVYGCDIVEHDLEPWTDANPDLKDLFSDTYGFRFLDENEEITVYLEKHASYDFDDKGNKWCLLDVQIQVGVGGCRRRMKNMRKFMALQSKAMLFAEYLTTVFEKNAIWYIAATKEEIEKRDLEIKTRQAQGKIMNCAKELVNFRRGQSRVINPNLTDEELKLVPREFSWSEGDKAYTFNNDAVRLIISRTL